MDTRPDTKSKLFGIGLSRTGTTSLTVALERLGWHTKHYPNPLKILQQAKVHDALTDIPVILAYRELAEIYPTAKFILTVRDIRSWLKSCEAHWKKKKDRGEFGLLVRRAVYGRADFNVATFKYIYNRHIREARAALGRRVLLLDIVGGAGYKELCGFLEIPVLNEQFPKAQGGNDRKFVDEKN